LVKALLFCGDCRLIVAVVQHNRIPHLFTCPNCGSKRHVRWQHNWDGVPDHLRCYMIATCMNSKMGEQLRLKFSCLGLEVRAV